jgi:mono/diheme cytochrome c family protein
VVGAKTTQRWAEFQKTVQPFFAKHCISCHSEKGVESDAPLDMFRDDASLDKGMPLLEKALDMLAAQKMPPRKKTQPTKDEAAPVLAWLKTYTNAVDCNAPRNPGRVTIRRLNRAEYNNTIRDLLAVEFRPADSFPLDDAGYGFDNIADVLSLSPLLMEKYLTAASLVLDKAIFVQPILPAPSKRWDAATAEGTFPKSDPNAGAEASGKVGKATRVGRVFAHNGEVYADFNFPADGDYTFRLRAYSSAGSNKQRPKATFLLDGKKLQEFNVREDQRNTSDYGSKPIAVSAGKHRISVAMLNGADPKAAKQDGPKLGLIWFEVEGPLAPTVDRMPDSFKRVFVATPSAKVTKADAAEKIIRNFATRAFRRPVRDDEVTRLMKLWTKADKDGRPFERSVHFVLQAVLVSPHFLFRIELEPQPGEKDNVHTLNEFELASRLSYFLWSSMPDAELFALAGKGKLRANLDAQIKRMLKDRKSQALIDNFAGQWLQLRLMQSVSPDAKKHPQFDEGLRSAMMQETQMFLNAIIQEDRSVLDIIDSDFTFVNERLAKHYGIPDVKGPDFRRIKLAPDQRGGLLLHASILTITSYPERTSPVQRGRWVLETFLNQAPPPPPPDVPELPKDDKILKKASLRQLMVQHRTNPNCAACHEKMDPIGFALENYDAIGAWRTRDANKEPIDASGELPDGKRFNGSRELREILKAQPEQFSRALTEKLLTYALGRGLERYDRCVVNDIVAAAQRNQYRFSVFVAEIVKSDPFQKRNGK